MSALAPQIAAFLAARDAGAVDAAVLQPAEPFLDMAGEDLRRRIFLTESETGETLCLRPEWTIPVCLDHIASQAGTPRRYSYCGEVFRQPVGIRHRENLASRVGLQPRLGVLGRGEVVHLVAERRADRAQVLRVDQ